MQKKHIIYFIALAIAILALIWDRLNPPDNASAASADVLMHPLNASIKHNEPPENNQRGTYRKSLQSMAKQESLERPILSSSGKIKLAVGKLADFFGCSQNTKNTKSNSTESTILTDCQRDIFSPTAGFIQAISPPKPVKAKPEVKVKSELKIKPEKLKLLSIMMGKHSSYAQINDKVLYPGQCIAGYQLVEIKHNRVIMRKSGQFVNLYMVNSERNK